MTQMEEEIYNLEKTKAAFGKYQTPWEGVTMINGISEGEERAKGTFWLVKAIKAHEYLVQW